MAQFTSKAVVLAILCAPSSLWPQNTGVVQGNVKDPSGAGIPKADVTLTMGEKQVRTSKTDSQGGFVMNGLAQADYVLRAIAPGFSPSTEAVQVVAGKTQRVDLSLSLRPRSEEITVDSQKAGIVDTDPASNAGAIVLRKTELEALSDDRDDLAVDLQALAGPAAGPNGGQIFIDGFTGGRLPPKQSIREVRINSNPFASQFDRPGQGRIEIFTKAGTNDYHGNLVFQFSDDALNSRNTFVAVKPPFQRRQIEGEISGPIGKKTSFFADFERRDITENAIVNAIILDASLIPTPFATAVTTPIANSEANLKVDRQLSANHTLAARYTFANDTTENQGVGGFSLPQRAYNGRGREDTIQLVETGILNTRTVIETRFRFRHQTSDQSGGVVQPTLSVLDAFTSGGSPVGVSFNRQNRYELQNFTTQVHGPHAVRWGVLIRAVSLTDQSMQNYTGAFTFTSLASYRTTLLGIQQGLPAEQIRVAGGGASQFSLSAGNPLAGIDQVDVGVFVQDDWRILPNLTLSGGLRFEAQTHAGDWKDFGPRLGFAWGLDSKKSKAPRTVIRGGAGLFYDRLSESLTLDALRQDGIRQQQFLVPDPNFFPQVPSTQVLSGSRQPQTIRVTDSHWRAPVMIQAALGLERKVSKKLTVSTNYIHSHGSHALRSRNINAPLPGIGSQPYGTVNGIYLYESSGVYRQNQLITNFNLRAGSKLSLSGFYAFGNAHSNTDGAGTFPANQYDLTTEYGRAGFDVRHRVQFNGSWSPKWGLRFSPFLTLASGRPFNITTGSDVNGDGLFNDRPAFATDLSRPTVVRTSLGTFDRSPTNGQNILPRNYAQGPGLVSANLRVGKTITLREPRDPKSGDPLLMVVSVNARNILNHPNYGSPIGNLSSPVFGQSTSLASGGGSSGTRRVDLHVRFEF